MRLAQPIETKRKVWLRGVDSSYRTGHFCLHYMVNPDPITHLQFAANTGQLGILLDYMRNWGW